MSYPSNFYIRPALGIKIRDPQSGEYLPDCGMLVPRSGFWLRRLKAGDVEELKQSTVKELSQPVADEPKATKAVKKD